MYQQSMGLLELSLSGKKKKSGNNTRQAFSRPFAKKFRIMCDMGTSHVIRKVVLEA